MIRTALIVAAALAACLAAADAAAQAGSPVRKLGAASDSRWAVVRAGEQKASHCVMGLRSDAAAPQPGKPQFMIAADGDFAILRVRAAEWSFDAARDIAVTLMTADGRETATAAVVRGRDVVDIAIGVAPERMAELSVSDFLEVRAEGGTVRLPLSGMDGALPAFRACLAGIGKPLKPEIHAFALR